MQSSTRTGEVAPSSYEAANIEPSLEAANMEPASFEPAIEPASADVATTEVQRSLIVSTREQCSACSVAMASDQRYCVECGERRGPARVPLMDGLAQRAAEAPTPRRPPRRPRMSVNSTLIAGIGTLLLAMGVGVLIGRSGNATSAKSPPAQIFTVAGGGGAAASTTASQPASSGSATSTKSGATPTAASASPTSRPRSKKSTAPPPKIVKVGSPGHGPGYQNGHFTGNFFGE